LLNTFIEFVLSCVRYYAIATPSATQRLLLGLLEAPPSWAPDALDAAVQLVELLRAAEDYASGIRVSWILRWQTIYAVMLCF
jgi:hypothetical protein